MTDTEAYLHRSRFEKASYRRESLIKELRLIEASCDQPYSAVDGRTRAIIADLQNAGVGVDREVLGNDISQIASAIRETIKQLEEYNTGIIVVSNVEE